MNSQELKCFVVAADRLNFTRATKELYVTPPTITYASHSTFRRRIRCKTLYKR